MATVKTTKNGHHKLLKKSFDYILKKEKTSEGSLTSAMNTSVTHALSQFRALHTIYPEHKHKGEKILSHHYIQSFKPGEIEARQAHKLGQEFAYKAFGSDAVVVVATHTDRAHVHNHFYVCSVRLDGRRIVDNGRSLKRIRGISDELCLSYGLSVVSPPSKNNSMGYKEWKERKKGASWKEEIRMDIDRAIASSSSFESFTETLRSKGYEVNDKRKYLTLKREDYERPVRTVRLGDDYILFPV